MKAIQLIKFLGESVNNPSFLEFLETNNLDTKKFPKSERGKNQRSKLMYPISKLHGIELRFGFEKEVLELYEIIFSKPQSDGLQPIFEIEYPFGLHLNQKNADYEIILGNFVGFDEPQSRDYFYKNYAITIFFEPSDVNKKIKSIEISFAQNLTS